MLGWARQAAKQDAKELKVFLDLASKIVKVDKLSELQQFYQERLAPDFLYRRPSSLVPFRSDSSDSGVAETGCNDAAVVSGAGSGSRLRNGAGFVR